MKKMKKILCFLLAFVLTFGGMSGTAFAATGTRPADGTTWDQPFDVGTGGSQQFRIPCLVSLDDGTIVAGCDARWTTYRDGGGLDTIISYSKDNGNTWNYTFANYLGDNGNVHNNGSTAFIDPAMATDGETVWLIADLYPAGTALNGATYRPVAGHTGYDANGNLVLAAVTESVNGGSNTSDRAAAAFDYHLEKIDGAADDAESYYALKDASGNTVEGYTIDAYFNIKGDGVDTNLFIADSPYFPYPTDFLYMTKSTDGGKTWSIPSLIDIKGAEEQTLLVGPGRGTVTSRGRIVFTAYEWTGDDIASCAFWSEDGGETWTRGEDVSSKSSEAAVTEADGKLYMFTRHGNAYYTSNDWGATWSEQKRTDLSYDAGCEVTAITYSEKIDGKTAILFAAPAGGRQNGKIFVGLVQEDGTISWDYEYKVNENAHYAYSCLTELADGSIGLLYEHGPSEIKYINIPIEDIANGAKIGTIWTEDNEQNPVYSVQVAPGASTTLNVGGNTGNAAIEVSSANENVASAAVNADGTITVTGSASVTGLADTTITVTAGSAKTVLKVYVTASEKFEIVELRPGETKTYVDETGNYGNQVVLDNSVATVTVSDKTQTDAEDGYEVVSTKLQGQLATAAGNFNGEVVDISKCLYTFTAAEGDNNYTISNVTADGTEVYLNHKLANSRANTANSAVITVAKDATEAKFSLLDNSEGNNGRYLYFHKNNTGKLYFDRLNSVDANNGWFELYQKSDSAPADSEIPGYAKVTSLSEIQNGGKYLIAAKADNGKYYVLYPALDGDQYKHVAQVGELQTARSSTDAAAQLGSSTAFDGKTIPARDCLYTFTSTGTENQYRISGTTSDGTTVHLNLASGTAPNRGEEASINVVAATDGEGQTFKLYDVAVSRYLHFHNSSSGLHYDRCSNTHAADNYEIFTPSAFAPNDSPIKGYVKVTSLDEITSGGKYLIARRADNNNYYIMHPANTGGNYAYVAKITGEEYAPEPETTIVIEAVGEGETSVKVGDVTYYIYVENKEMDVTLEIGESINIPGAISKMEEGQNVVSTEDVAEMAPYKAVTDIESGKKYLLESRGSVLINSVSTVDQNSLGMAQVDFATNLYPDYMWTITATEGGYLIQDVNGKYVNFSGTSVTLSDEAPAALTIGTSAAGGLHVYNGSNYLNNYGGNGNRVAGYHADDCPWNFYEPSTGIKITGEKEGYTVVTVGDMEYNITVTERAIVAAKNELQEQVNDVVEENFVQEDYTTESWAAFANALARAREVLSDPDASQEEVEQAKTALAEAQQDLVEKPSDDKEDDNTDDNTDDAQQNPGGSSNNNSSNKDSNKTSGTSTSQKTTTSTATRVGTYVPITTTAASTGDSANTVLYVGLMAAAAAVVMYLKKKYYVTK